MSWQTPEPGLLARVVSTASTSLLVASPFVKQYGLSIVQESLSHDVESLEFWTRMDSRDWITGATDPDAVLEFLETNSKVRRVSLFTSSVLHTKLIVADEKVAAVGSGNLTRGGWGNNIEIVKPVDGDEISSIRDYVANTRPLLTTTSLVEYSKFVERCLAFAKEKEALLDLVREATPTPPQGRGPLVPLPEFIRYCSITGGEVANSVVRIHSNIDHNNRQGHIKQGYYAAQRFFQEYPNHLASVAESSLEEPFDLENSDLFGDWLQFLRDFRDEADGDYDYDIGTLINIIPTSVGGTVTGGGGGGYPLRITFPIAARMLTEEETR